jgi:hypothetical protein
MPFACRFSVICCAILLQVVSLEYGLNSGLFAKVSKRRNEADA